MIANATYNGRFAFPTDVIFGPETIRTAGREMAFGKRALVVTDAGLRAAGIVDRVVSALHEAGVGTVVFDGVQANPTEADVCAGLGRLADEDCDYIVAVGGGSPLDAAKVIRLMQHHPFPLERYDVATGGDALITGHLAPLVAVPTTSGTGSEVSRSAVIAPSALPRKIVIFSPRLLPTLAVCDPDLTVGLSAGLTAATGADALTHAVEAYLARGFHPLADALAMQAIHYVFKYLRRVVVCPSDIEARTYMMLASMLGAVAFQKGLGACHSMAHAITAVHEVHHGLANAICLPAVVAFNAEAAPERLRDLDRGAGNAIGLLSNGDAASHFLFELRNLFDDAGLPASLRSAGVAAPDFGRLADYALADGCHGLNPRPVDRADFRGLFEEVA